MPRVFWSVPLKKWYPESKANALKSKTMYTIRLIEEEKMESVVPLLHELNPKISVDTLNQRLKEMLTVGYQCMGAFDGNKLIGISGIWTLTKYYIGKHIEPDNVFILPEYQGKGIGKLMMDRIYEYAQSIGCVASELNCYPENERAQKFWKNEGYELVAYHYRKRFQS